MNYEKWGNVTLLETKTEPLFCTNEWGAKYLADPVGGPTYLTLQCDCGYIWTIDQKDFKGRKFTRTCGLDECTVSAAKGAEKPLKKLGRQPVADRGVAVCIYVPGSVLAEASDMSRKRGIAIGQIFAQCFKTSKELI